MLLEPAPGEWASLLEKSWRGRNFARASAFRRQIGLADDAPIVMTGHQLSWWHPGVLAKFIAADSFARRAGAGPAWIWVDQDEHEFATIEAPTKSSDGALAAERVPLAPVGAVGEGWPVRSCPSFTPRAPSTRNPPALASVDAGLTRLRAALSHLPASGSAAEQIARALTDLMSPHVPPAPAVFGTSLALTDLFQDLASRMAADPAAAIGAYNRAAAANPAAGVALLDIGASRGPELPLWRIRPRQPRARIFAQDLASIPAHELAPRALFMTALLRLAGCDLFIHGVGGGEYDKVTEAWIRDWLGETLAPRAIVSATLRLPLGAPHSNDSDAATAIWRAHSARHNPALLNDPAAASAKHRRLSEIEAARQAGADPAPIFRTMHEELRQYRSARDARLAELDHAVERARARESEAELAAARDWFFALCDPSALAQLRELIDRALAPSPQPAALKATAPARP